MDWTQTLTIIATLLGVTAWLDHKHRQEMDKMDERWKWLDSVHRQEMDKMDENRRLDIANHKEDTKAMDERWKWLFERIETKLDQIKVKP